MGTSAKPANQGQSSSNEDPPSTDGATCLVQAVAAAPHPPLHRPPRPPRRRSATRAHAQTAPPAHAGLPPRPQTLNPRHCAGLPPQPQTLNPAQLHAPPCCRRLPAAHASPFLQHPPLHQTLDPAQRRSAPARCRSPALQRAPSRQRPPPLLHPPQQHLMRRLAPG